MNGLQHLVLFTLTIIVIEAALLNDVNVERKNYEMSNRLIDKPGRKKFKLKREEIMDDNETSNDWNKLIPKLDRIARSLLNDEERSKRNVTSLKEFVGAKKKYKKLKFSMIQGGYKGTKNKEGSKEFDSDKYVEEPRKKISRRHVDSLVNEKNRTNSSKQHGTLKNLDEVKSDYYAKKKAIMDRFYSRQKQIEEKFAKKTGENSLEKSDKMKSSKSTNSEKVNVQKSKVLEPALVTNVTNSTKTTEATTKSNRRKHPNYIENLAEDNLVEQTFPEYNYIPNILTISGLNRTSNENKENKVFQNDEDNHHNTDTKATLEWGVCKGKMLYQQNLIITADKAKQTDANVTASVDGPYCITCAKLIPMAPTTAQASLHKDESAENQMIVKFRGIQSQQLFYNLKLWAADKKNNKCT